MMFELLFNLIKWIFIIIIIPLTLFLLISLPLVLCIGVYGVFNYAGSLVDESKCILYVDNTPVYDGYCHFIEVSSIGENGNSKRAVVFKDKSLFFPLKQYISENVRVEECQK